MYGRWIVRRFVQLLTVVWAAATLNFIIPHISPRNPIAKKITKMAATSGIDPDKIKEMSEVFSAKFGLNEPLIIQYIHYLYDIIRLDFGQSIVAYPAHVSTLIAAAMPWTLGLMFCASFIAIVVGSLLGAASAWLHNSRALQLVTALMMVLSALPFYLIGLVLIYCLAVVTGWFPVSGGYDLISVPNWSWEFAVDVLHHGILPAMSIVIASIGVWAINMRGMMVSVYGENYVTYAEMRGLKPWRIFLRYGLRNALLPQVTALALQFGEIVTGAILVEIVFGYPGIGTLLFESISLFDYPTIYGIVAILIGTIAVSMFVLDILCPLIDPRIAVES